MVMEGVGIGWMRNPKPVSPPTPATPLGLGQVRDWLTILFHGWTNRHTKLLVVSFNVYSQGIDSFLSCDVIFEVSNTGFISKRV